MYVLLPCVSFFALVFIPLPLPLSLSTSRGPPLLSLPTNEDSSSGWLLWVDNSRSELVIPNETRDSLLDYFCGETEKEKEEGKGGGTRVDDE